MTWACRREYANTAVDVISRRTRLSFLNAEAALEALPRVIDIMAAELGWSKSRINKEFQDATAFLESMGIARSRTINLTLDDVRQGKHRSHMKVDDDYLSRTVFNASELAELKVSFPFSLVHDGVRADPPLPLPPRRSSPRYDTFKDGFRHLLTSTRYFRRLTRTATATFPRPTSAPPWRSWASRCPRCVLSRVRAGIVC